MNRSVYKKQTLCYEKQLDKFSHQIRFMYWLIAGNWVYSWPWHYQPFCYHIDKFVDRITGWLLMYQRQKKLLFCKSILMSKNIQYYQRNKDNQNFRKSTCTHAYQTYFLMTHLQWRPDRLLQFHCHTVESWEQTQIGTHHQSWRHFLCLFCPF